MFYLAHRRLAFAEINGYDTDAQAYIDRLTGTYSGTELDAINAFFVSLKANSIYSKLDVLYIHALDNATDGLLNINGTSFTATRVNSMTFTARQGFTGNSSNMYLDTNFNVNTLNAASASIGTYLRTNQNDDTGMGIYDATLQNMYILPRAGGNSAWRAVWTVSAGAESTQSQSNAQGLHVIARTGASAAARYKNGVSGGTSTVTNSGAFSSTNIIIGSASVDGNPTTLAGTGQHALSLIGQGLDATENSNLFTAVETLLDAFGAGVVT